MNVVIVADLDMAEGVNTCVLGYCSEYGWEELDVVPRPLPQKKDIDKTLEFGGYENIIQESLARGYNACIEEIQNDN